MNNKKGFNPIVLGLGVVAGAFGAVGAMLLSKKENRKKAATIVKQAGNVSGDRLESVLKNIRDILGDLDAFNSQKALDKPKKTATKKKSSSKV